MTPSVTRWRDATGCSTVCRWTDPTRLWAEALDMRAWHPEKFASRDAPSRGVTAIGRPVAPLLKAASTGNNVWRFARIVKWDSRSDSALRSGRFVGRVFTVAKLGMRLAICFLDRAFPDAGGETQYAEWEDVQAIFFDLVKVVRPIAEGEGRKWSKANIRQLDDWLWQTAEAGQYSGAIILRKGCAEEMLRRCEYALIGASLEEAAGKPLHMAFPSDVPDDAKAFALMLFILGGPARDYRRDMHPPEGKAVH